MWKQVRANKRVKTECRSDRKGSTVAIVREPKAQEKAPNEVRPLLGVRMYSRNQTELYHIIGEKQRFQLFPQIRSLTRRPVGLRLG